MQPLLCTMQNTDSQNSHCYATDYIQRVKRCRNTATTAIKISSSEEMLRDVLITAHLCQEILEISRLAL